MSGDKVATIKAATRYGEMTVFAHDLFASQSLVKYGEWAQNELNVLAQFIRPGAIVVDGGGYVGSHSLAFSHFVGAEGVVHTFEPNPVAFAILSRNVGDNRCANVVLHAQGLAATAIELKAAPLDFEQEGNFGGASFHALEGGTGAPFPTSPVNNFNFVALDETLPHADFLKLDLEGMEVEALSGADRILRLDRPQVFAECNSIAHGAALLAAMSARGYRAFGCLVHAFNPDNFRGVADNIFQDAMEFGLMFVHDSKLEESKAAIATSGLLEVSDEDSLAAYLFRKPQYPSEVLRSTAQWRALDLEARFRLLAQFNNIVEPTLVGDGNAGDGNTLGGSSDLTTVLAVRLEERAIAKETIDRLQAALTETQVLARERLQEADRIQSALDIVQSLTEQRQQELDQIQSALSEVQNLAHERYDEIEALAAQRDAAQASAKASRASVKECLRQIDTLRATICDVEALAVERTAQRDHARSALRVAQGPG